MKTKYFYIHGFGSSIESETLSRFKAAGYDIDGLTYDHTTPEISINKMALKIAKSYKDSDWTVIIGSSLGGWYTEKLHRYIAADFVMFNPSVNPVTSLLKYGVSQEVCDLYVNDDIPSFGYSRSVLLATDDEVLDYTVAEKLYKDTADIKYTYGGHRMTDTSFADLCKILEANENKV